jgi:hypothetical protein
MSGTRRTSRPRPEKRHRPRRPPPREFVLHNPGGGDPAASPELRRQLEGWVESDRVLYAATGNPVALWSAMMPAGMLHRYWGVPWPTWMVEALAAYGGRIVVLLDSRDPIDAVKEVPYELSFTGHRYNAFLEAHQLRAALTWLEEIRGRPPDEPKKVAVGRIARREKLSDSRVKQLLALAEEVHRHK